MDIQQKLTNLQGYSDLCLYKWSAGTQRIAGAFAMLSNLRLTTLMCRDGQLTFSSAAPVVFMDRGRASVRLYDNGVLTVSSGDRKGINIMSNFLKPGEEATPALFCDRVTVTTDESDNLPKWIKLRILSLGCSQAWPSYSIVTPEMYRISRNPESLRPVFTSQLITAIGGSTDDSLDVLLAKFKANIHMIGARTDDGVVVPNEYIASGGCCVVSAAGLGGRAGSVVHYMPLQLFLAEVAQRKWSIQCEECTKNC